MTTAGSLENQELMSQGKNLSVQRCAGPKSLPNLRKKRENDREHGISNLSPASFKFNYFNENGVFGRDNLAKASLLGFRRRRLLATDTALLASSLDFLQGTFEKIQLQGLVNQHALQLVDFLAERG